MWISGLWLFRATLVRSLNQSADPARQEDHEHEQSDSVDQGLIFLQSSEHLWCDDDDCRADEGTDTAAEPTYDRERQ